MTSYRTYPLSNEFHLRSVGLSKVAGCRRKSPPTWLVSAGYSAWHFFTGSVFLKKISLDWSLTLTTQPSTSKHSDNPDVKARTFQAEGFDLPALTPVAGKCLFRKFNRTTKDTNLVDYEYSPFFLRDSRASETRLEDYS